jgi:hypothetical protein
MEGSRKSHAANHRKEKVEVGVFTWVNPTEFRGRGKKFPTALCGVPRRPFRGRLHPLAEADLEPFEAHLLLLPFLTDGSGLGLVADQIKMTDISVHGVVLSTGW